MGRWWGQSIDIHCLAQPPLCTQPHTTPPHSVSSPVHPPPQTPSQHHATPTHMPHPHPATHLPHHREGRGEWLQGPMQGECTGMCPNPSCSHMLYLAGTDHAPDLLPSWHPMAACPALPHARSTCQLWVVVVVGGGSGAWGHRVPCKKAHMMYGQCPSLIAYRAGCTPLPTPCMGSTCLLQTMEGAGAQHQAAPRGTGRGHGQCPLAAAHGHGGGHALHCRSPHGTLQPCAIPLLCFHAPNMGGHGTWP